ncbi:Retrovirus-related Pol polyprotein from transposon opus [Vitis vinifera]|uniref:Retrovirus-related Pol polyprotein from transposon opus n=1 Tax=Vitis vinifera TaxID=29760 RepID=A0A438CCT6_VITVI|nr:Retrovirus-related Pol polyprotein from transposon opus [Vitis vinifera]
MPFGLKNAGATYQRLMTKIFKPLVGRTVEVYIDDIVVKSKTREEHTLHLQEVFHLLRKGIEVSPDQVKAVMETPPPRSKKELQRLTGKLVALGRFIAASLMSCDPSSWQYEKLERADGRTALVVSEWAISAVLFRYPSPKEQKPIYYVSRALEDVETRYSKMELTALALRSAAQKLRPYFQAHPVVVLTDQPLRNILHKPDLTGRMLQWAIELSKYGIEFQPRLSMKGQVMADFVLEYSRRPIQRKEPSEKEWWTLRVDGASRSSGFGVGLLLQSPTGEHLEQVIRLGFPASNNEAEYEAILSGLDLALALSVSRLRVYSDSQLVVRHVQKEYEAKDTRMAQYLAKVRDTLQRHSCFPPHQRSHIIGLCMCKPTLPSRKPPLANTIEANQADDQEWTEDIIRAHSQGYYWPTMKKDTAAYVKKCDKCQRHAPIPHVPSETLKPISGPYPFAQCGRDIVGPLPAAAAQKKFLLVATDYFSKWVEAEAYASIKDKDVTKFNFCSELNIRNSYSTPRYPQSNGQAEATNKTLITALKKRLEQAKGKWVEELPGVLWAYRTTPRRPTGNTPFALAYSMDAIIPTEIGLSTIRTEAGRQDDANAELGRNLDWADEVRETASIRMADYQQRAAAHYNCKARPRSFKSGTLVLKKVFENTAETGAGKFQANWKTPI